jgi:hypothetical protein
MIRYPREGGHAFLGRAGVVSPSHAGSKVLTANVVCRWNVPDGKTERRERSGAERPRTAILEEGGRGGQGVIASGASGASAASAAGKGRPTGREGRGLSAVAVAVYILHLRESTPAIGTIHRERRLAGDFRV